MKQIDWIIIALVTVLIAFIVFTVNKPSKFITKCIKSHTEIVIVPNVALNCAVMRCAPLYHMPEEQQVCDKEITIPNPDFNK